MKLNEAKAHLMKVLPTLDNLTQSAIKTLLASANSLTVQIFDENVKEEWHDVKGYNGRYQVSNLGRVRSNFSGKWKNLKPHNTKGYLIVALSYKGKVTKRSVHVLVAEAFIENPENKPLVNHKDANPMNCQVSNLEWSTYSENTIHAFNNGLIRTYRGTNHYSAKFTVEEVKFIRKMYKPYDKEFGMSAMARKFEVNLRTMMEVIQGKSYKDVEN